MRITGLSVRRIRIDSAPWYGGTTPTGEPRSFQLPLLELTTDEGLTGHSTGYCPLGQGPGATRLLADVYTRVLVGRDPLDHEAIWEDMRRMHRHLYTVSEALMGQVDVAVWDLRGKALGQPISRLLGQRRPGIATYGTASYVLPTPESAADEVRRIRAAGYRAAKLNLHGGPASDLPKVQAAREAVGPDFGLMLDGSGHLSFADALTVGRELDRLGYLWFEEPLYDRQLSTLGRLADALDLPILGAETLSLLELAEALTRGTFDLVRGDVSIKAGVTGLKKATDMCQLLGVGLEIHVCTSPLLDVANLHVACATGSCQLIESHHEMFRVGLLDDPLEIDADGMLWCPTGPGLGVQLDWDWIDDHTVEQVTADESV